MEYRSLSRLVYLAAGLFVAIWFLHEVIDVILLLFFAIVITIVLNAPVTWLQKKKMSRTAASLLVFFGVLAVFGLIGWIIIPKIVTQVKLLITQLPDYLDSLNKRVLGWIGDKVQIMVMCLRLLRRLPTSWPHILPPRSIYPGHFQECFIGHFLFLPGYLHAYKTATLTGNLSLLFPGSKKR
jgi:hypothetical protein